jgi:EmrB/QacA subfamily drug resistance transporter
MALAVRLPCEAAAIRAGDCPPDVRGDRGPWVLAATILGSSLAFIDGTVVTVALPALAREFDASGADLAWVVEAYALFLSALLLVGGSLGDRYGRKRVYAIGIVLFALASAGCAFAGSVAQLVLARSVQGIGAALLVPGSLALIAASFPPNKRGAAIGTWSGFSGITAAIGPLVGGWLVAHSWRWAFFVNLPLAAVVLVLLTRVPESRNPRARKLDVPGAALVTLGLGGLVFGLIESSRRGWADGAVLLGIVGGALALAAFVEVERRSASPMMPLSLFRSSTFAGANLLTLFLYGALSCVFYFLPLDLIQVHGYSPLAAGAAMLPFIVVMFLLSRWSGGLVARHGARGPLIIGPAIAAVGFVLLALPGVGGPYWTTFFPGVCVLGFGMAVAVAPLTTAVMNSVESEDAGIASGVNNAVSRTGGLLAIALLGILLTVVFERALADRLAESANMTDAARASTWAARARLASMEPSAGMTASDANAARSAVDLAFVAGFRAVALASAGLAIAASLCAAITVERPRQS